MHMGLMYGNVRPSVIEDCIGYEREDPAWQAAVLHVMRKFTPNEWPPLYLAKYSVTEED